MDDKFYQIGTGNTAFTVAEFTEKLGICGPFSYRATYNDGLDMPIPGILEFDTMNRVFNIANIEDHSLAGTVYIITVYGLASGKEVSTSFTLILTTSSCKVTNLVPSSSDLIDPSSDSLTTSYYVVRNLPLTIPFHNFDQNHGCIRPVTYSLSIVGFATVPSQLITSDFTTEPKSITIYTTQRSYAQNTLYTLVVTGSVTNEDSSVV